MLLLGALLVVATYTFPLWSPLLENDTIEEAFPGLAQELQATFAALPPTQQAAYLNLRATDAALGEALVLAALGADTPVPTEQQAMPTLEAPLIVGRGTFGQVDAIRWAEGRFTLYEQPDNNRVLRLEGFRSARAPNLRVILWATAFPEEARDLRTFLNAPLDLGPLDIDLGALQGTVGDQNYAIPPQVNLNLYNSIVIYEQRYRLIFSVAPIQ